jgi:hypothetical protein
MIGDILLSIGQIVRIFGFIFKSIVWLRTIICIAACIIITSSVFIGLQAPGMKSVFGFNIIIFITNLLHLIRLINLKRDISISDDLKQIYEKYFITLKPREFLHLMTCATLNEGQKGEVLIKQNHKTDLLFLKTGSVEIKVDNNVIETISDNMFLGDFSFIGNINTVASVACVGDVSYYQWKKENLTKVSKSLPHIYENFKQIVSLSIVNKIIENNKKSALGKNKGDTGTIDSI